MLRGRVTDPDDAVIPGATISLLSGGKVKSTTVSRADGGYTLGPVPAGSYTLVVQANQFSTVTETNVVLSPAQSLSMNFKLLIQTQTQQVVVTAQSNALDTSPDNNASTVVIKGKDLDALSDDPNELQNELTALAGPSVGPNGGQIYVDGFTAGQLPPKSSIREIRINQNPFSAQYDQPGYGRIEILTKPGTDKLHGQGTVLGNPSALNTSNPFSPMQPSYYTDMFMGNLSGALNKNASFFLDGMYRNLQDNTIVNATVLQSSCMTEPPTTACSGATAMPYTQALPMPTIYKEIGPRVDMQLGANNTLSVRYQYQINKTTDNGVGGFDLQSTGFNSSFLENQVQMIDTQTIGTKVVNETRFQFLGDISHTTPLNANPSINVLGNFNGGGSSGGSVVDRENHYELQNYTSVALKKNFIRAGGRLRVQTSNTTSTSGYNGQFTFSSMQDFIAAQQATFTSGKATLASTDRFNITFGTPLATLNYYDLGLYAETDWTARKNLTISYGGRWETQSWISDHRDGSPRVSIAWGLGSKNGKPPTTVLRAGYGIFYSRFQSGSLMQAQRLNPYTGTQQSFSIPGNDVNFFPNLPSESAISSLSTTTPSYYSLSPNLRASYTLQTGLTIDHTISKALTVSVTYLNSRGQRVATAEDINAPVYPTAPGAATPRPLANLPGQTNNNYNLFQYTPEASFKQNQLIANVRMQGGKYGSFGAFYMLNYANGDTVGTPSNSYNLKADYGPTGYDVRQRMFFFGSFNLPYQISMSPSLFLFTGSPYSITSGNDFDDDSVFNDRPGIASAARIAQCASASSSCFGQVVSTPVGTFDVDPYSSYNENIVPIDTQRGPLVATFNLSIGKSFGFGPLKNASAGPAGGGPGGMMMMFMGGPGGGGKNARKYTVTLSGRANNLFNIADYATPSGTLSPSVSNGAVTYSSEFGVSQQLASGPFTTNSAIRRVYLTATFSF
jgi:hypothetical protein